MSFIRFVGATKSYRMGEHVIRPLENVHLEVLRGEFLVLLGPSGSGKSTLLNLAAGIDRPDEGQVFVGGVDVTALSQKKAAVWRSKATGYVFQDYSLIPVLNAYENVEIPLWLHRMSARERHNRVALALEAVGLSDRAKHRPRELSGGQQQRVAIARAIVTDPDLLLADEPTGNLDEQSADEVLVLLQRLNRERNKTILMVTHDLRAAASGSRALRLDKGKLHAIGGGNP